MLMGSVPRNIELDDIKHDLEKASSSPAWKISSPNPALKIPGVRSVHELHVWRLNQRKTLASVHIVTLEKTLSSFADIARIIHECFHAYGIHSATLQPKIAIPVENQESDTTSSLRQRPAARASTICQNACGSLCEPLMCCG
jgi:zinc transporter 1